MAYAKPVSGSASALTSITELTGYTISATAAAVVELRNTTSGGALGPTIRVAINATQSIDHAHPITWDDGGAWYVNVVSGTVTWCLFGR